MVPDSSLVAAVGRESHGHLELGRRDKDRVGRPQADWEDNMGRRHGELEEASTEAGRLAHRIFDSDQPWLGC